MNVIRWWVEFLNPFNIDATLFAFVWVLGTVRALILLTWMLSRADFGSPTELVLFAAIAPLELAWAPYAGLCMVLMCAVVITTIILVEVVWILAQVFGTSESEMLFYPVIR